jgi:hypothetical protein
LLVTSAVPASEAYPTLKEEALILVIYAHGTCNLPLSSIVQPPIVPLVAVILPEISASEAYSLPSLVTPNLLPAIIRHALVEHSLIFVASD